MQMLGYKLAKNSHGRRFGTVGQGNERKACALIQRRVMGSSTKLPLAMASRAGLMRPRNTASLPCTACSKLLISLQRRVTATWGQLRAHSG